MKVPSASVIDVADAAAFDFVAASRGEGALALFTAPWCSPGERLADALARLAPTLSVPVLKVDSDRTPALPRRYGVAGLPSLLFLRHGFVAAKRSGELSEEDLRRWVEANLTPA
jgi:thioredoxin-like negative regulator of GroEL